MVTEQNIVQRLTNNCLRVFDKRQIVTGIDSVNSAPQKILEKAHKALFAYVPPGLCI